MVEGKRSPIRCRRCAPKVAIWRWRYLVLALACGDRNTYAPPPPPKVTVSQPLKKPVTDYLEFTGNAVAFNTVPLKARVEGFLEKVLFQDGDVGEKGPSCCSSSNRNNIRPNSRRPKPRCWLKKPNWSMPKPSLSATPGWLKQDAAAQTDVDRWHYERDSRRAGGHGRRGPGYLAKLNLSYTRITAPFNGRMGRHLKDPGTLVGGGEETLSGRDQPDRPHLCLFQY